ncbi:FAD-dependent oxidoreductase [Lachnospiraceae bacterium OF11-28]|jgi:dihydrolipoamide dehydrogenase|nr:FAD-dependent oxidoreductase [Lacrimispora amygdalina]RGE08468.1 FAD-dependent oxidoreductase [Lachnospiraceae bacterium OF11-28]UYJ12635.1 MAG: FAD-dependent oxidoreductase [Lachnospiraceae bacterium]
MMYDVAIIGGGPGGYTAALRARNYGLSVVLFEHNEMGGTCLNRGCVPTKYLAHVAEINRQLSELGTYGIEAESNNINFRQTQKKNYEIVSNLRNSLSEQMISCGIEIVCGRAELQADKTIVCSGTSYYAQNIIVATGSMPKMRLSDNVLTSNEALMLKKIPTSVSIIGGGVIAVELAEIFSGLGAIVNIYIRGERILRNWDKDIAVGLTQSMKKRNIKIHAKYTYDMLCSVKDELIISALGRKAVLEGLDLGLFQIGENHGIIVDDNGYTGTQGLYAIGDVVENSPMLAHVAMEQGRKVIDFIACGVKSKRAAVIKCIYTTPEIASVGMTESEAKENGRSPVVGKQLMYTNARTMIATTERGFVKIIADAVSREVIGAQFMCERATDLIVEVASAINNRETIDKMLNTIRPHPGFSEAITDALEIIERRLRNEF